MAPSSWLKFISVVIVVSVEYVTATHDLMPLPCDHVHCPPLPELTCPDDSDERETMHSLTQLQSSTPSPLPNAITSAQWYSSADDVGEELFAQCCLNNKCLCKTCYIPDCRDNDQVMIELIPESMDTPGHCCGEYECQTEPNCTAVVDTDSYWLTNCQRCKCYSGERICTLSCDEGIKKSTGICNSKNLNTYFEHGESWRDGCYECECVNGEEKCVMPFCRSLNCPPNRQVMLKDSCCPVCWPKGAAMPNAGTDADEEENANTISEGHNYDSRQEFSVPQTSQNVTLPKDIEDLRNTSLDKIYPNSVMNTTIESPTTVSSAINKEPVQTKWVPNLTTTTITTTPTSMQEVDSRHGPPATYQVYPEVVQVLCRNDLLYAIVGMLALIVLILIAWNIHLRAKQRSYCPVSNFDDNCNIKKMTDYA